MSEEKGSESIRVVTFTGTDKKMWREWSQKTLAIGAGKKWKDALITNQQLSSITDKEEKDWTNEDKKKLTKNEATWTYLILACKDKAFNIIARHEDCIFAWRTKERDLYSLAGSVHVEIFRPI